jgi:hypothetical protein
MECDYVLDVGAGKAKLNFFRALIRVQGDSTHALQRTPHTHTQHPPPHTHTNA